MSKEELDLLRRQLEASLGASYDDVVDHLREQNRLDQIAGRLADGVAEVVVGLDEAGQRLAQTTIDGYDVAGKATAKWLDKKLSTKLVTYDSKSQRASQYAADTAARFVREISSDTRDVIRQVVTRQLSTGANPRVAARAIRDAIGLTAKQESYIASYRRALEAGDWTNALQRELRDGRSDKTLRRLIRDGDGSLTAKQVDSMVERYRKNWIAHRSEVIAQTESLSATHAGNWDILNEAVDGGSLDKADLEREWHTSGKANVRDSHVAMAHQKRALDDPFVSGNGNLLMYPGDDAAPAADRIHCHCVVSTVVVGVDEHTVKAPAGFDAQGKHVVEGLPPIEEPLNERLLYRVGIDDIRDELIALPGGGADDVRLQSIADAWDEGKQLPPVKLSRLADGRLFVGDGRHRLLTAMRDGRDVLVQLDTAPEGLDVGTVRLALPPPRPRVASPETDDARTASLGM